MKPKPLSKAAERVLSVAATNGGVVLTARQCRDVLAALEYERQRAEAAERKYMAVPPQHRGGLMQAIAENMLSPPETPFRYDVVKRQRETAAVAPKQRKKR